jgi:two-component system, NarL family, sensor kinase
METWQDPKVFAVWLSLVIVIVSLLAVGIIVFTKLYYKKRLEDQQKLNQAQIEHQKQLLESSLIIQERERDRIAADLHDSLIPRLNSVLFIENSAENSQQIRDLISRSITIARNISHELSPPLIEQSSIPELIDDFIAPLLKGYHIDIYQSRPASENIANPVKLHLFRITQEVINNIIKHAEARRIEIIYRETSTNISLNIKDDGKGFDVAQVSKGLGLKSMESRIQFLQGQYRIKSKPGKGSSFTFWVPGM